MPHFVHVELFVPPSGDYRVVVSAGHLVFTIAALMVHCCCVLFMFSSSVLCVLDCRLVGFGSSLQHTVP